MFDYCGNCVMERHECKCKKEIAFKTFRIQYSYTVQDSDSIDIEAEDLAAAKQIFIDEYTGDLDDYEIEDVSMIEAEEQGE